MREWKHGPSHRPRSKRCPETDALAPRALPVRARTAVRGNASPRTTRVRVRIKGSDPALQPMLVTQWPWGYNGILWDFVGNLGKWRNSAVCPATLSAFRGCVAGLLNLWISL